jgi:hypothetical protein
VTTIELQPDLAVSAETQLREAGYDDVSVLSGDGAHGHPTAAPYDRIMLTASAPGLSEAWWRQLRPGSVLVLPLRWQGGQAVFALQRTADGFESERVAPGGFMYMQGELDPNSGLRQREAAHGAARLVGAAYIGPRRDIWVSPAPSSPRRRDMLYRLLALEPRVDGPEALLLSEGERPGALDQSLACYLAFSDQPITEISIRNNIYGFFYGAGLIHPGLTSAAVVIPPAFGPPDPSLPPGSGPPAPTPRLLSYGDDSMRRRFFELTDAFVALERPGVERLHLTAHLTDGAWTYAFRYE